MNDRVIAVNRKARFEFHLEEFFEAGIVLNGAEVKSLREGKGSLSDAYARVVKEEIWLHNLHITPYESANLPKGSHIKQDPKRPRKLLLHKDEIKKLIGKTEQKGYTLIPVKLYFSKRGLVKIEIALGKGKKLFDKREAIAEKEAKRQLERTVKGNR